MYIEVPLALLKPIIRPWEKIVHNKHKTDLGYDKKVSFHIPNYSKPIQFQSVGFLKESSSSSTLVKSSKCQHCDRVGHMKNQCFDFHPCKHCGKHTHSSDICFILKKPTKEKIQYGWIASWK